MCVSFGSLAQQGFLAGFSDRERSEQEKPVSAKKIAQRAFSPACSGRKAAFLFSFFVLILRSFLFHCIFSGEAVYFILSHFLFPLRSKEALPVCESP